MADGSYTYKCRIGNWSEDYELEQLRMKDYLSRKSSNQLLITQYQQKMHESLQRVELSQCADGFVHFGDDVLLYSVQTKGVLANDVGERVVTCGTTGYTVTTSTVVKGAASRNVYVIEPLDINNNNSQIGDVLRFGQDFRIRAHPKLVSTPMYLHSQPVSPLSASKYSHHQEVILHPDTNYDSVWKIVHTDPSIQFEMQHEAIPANAQLLIVHTQTNQCLSSDFIKHENEFGVEFEVCAHTFSESAKNQTMKQEFQGDITPDTAQRSALAKNRWAILMSCSDDTNNIKTPGDISNDTSVTASAH